MGLNLGSYNYALKKIHFIGPSDNEALLLVCEIIPIIYDVT